MSQPIVLWDAQRHTNHVFDDAGISIAKTILAPPVPPAPYDTEPPNNLRTVPPLAYFCIRALTPYADQLHHLQHPIPFRRDVIRALIPSKIVPRDVLVARKQDSRSKIDSDTLCSGFDVQSTDPRLWATIAQVMHPLPAEFRDYEIPLSDGHLPLLQQVPSRENFSFVTLLALPGCGEVSDETIGVIRRLNTLIALDLRGTSIGSYGLTVLARGLSWSDDELQSRTGCWGLRILRLHSCTNIGNEALPILSKFPLLSSIDLRFTRCTRTRCLQTSCCCWLHTLLKSYLVSPRSTRCFAQRARTPSPTFSLFVPDHIRIQATRFQAQPPHILARAETLPAYAPELAA
ncbi:hypothetical protein DFH29DRAFT_1053385 [Suillus ampliporus]|nr:hypothetical protein DFH29DRAFT_1053385 [Suillus ampliporus]